MPSGHGYSVFTESSTGRSGVYGVLGVVATYAGLALRGYIVSQFQDKAGNVPAFLITFGALTPLLLFGLLVVVFDRAAWKWQISRPVYWLGRDTRPLNISGEYHGVLTWKSQSGSDPPESDCVVVVSQHWQKISVSFDFLDPKWHVRARSSSHLASVEMNMKKDRMTLTYTYDYTGLTVLGANGIQVLQIKGTAVLHFEKSDSGLWRASGFYYSSDGGSGIMKLEQKLTEQSFWQSIRDFVSPKPNAPSTVSTPPKAEAIAGLQSTPDGVGADSLQSNHGSPPPLRGLLEESEIAPNAKSIDGHQ